MRISASKAFLETLLFCVTVTGNGPSAATPSCSGLNGPTTSPRPLQAAAVVRPSAAWTPPTASGSMPKVPSPAVAKAEPLPSECTALLVLSLVPLALTFGFFRYSQLLNPLVMLCVQVH